MISIACYYKRFYAKKNSTFFFVVINNKIFIYTHKHLTFSNK